MKAKKLERIAAMAQQEIYRRAIIIKQQLAAMDHKAQEIQFLQQFPWSIKDKSMIRYLTKILSVFLIGIFILPMSSYACEMSDFAIGKKASQVASAINNPDINDFEGSFEVPMRGSRLCDELPPESRASLVFLDDILVQIKIEGTSTGGKLLVFAENKFGAIQKKEPADKSHEYFWPDLGNYMAVYSLQKVGNLSREYIDISSKEHKKLFSDEYKRMEE